jgi:hypothetical protein
VHRRLPRAFEQKPRTTDQGYNSKTDTERDGRGKWVTFAHTARRGTGSTADGSIRKINK